MKKIFLIMSLLMLVACDSPFDKYKDSVDALKGNAEAVTRVQEQITVIQDLLEANPNFDPATITVVEVAQLNDSLASIKEELVAGNLDVILSQAAQNPEETTKILEQVELYKADTQAAIDAIPADDPRKAEMVEALANATDIVALMQAKIAV